MSRYARAHMVFALPPDAEASSWLGRVFARTKAGGVPLNIGGPAALMQDIGAVETPGAKPVIWDAPQYWSN